MERDALPNFRFSLQRSAVKSRDIALDLPDTWAVELVAKQVARNLAAKELGSGHLSLAQDLLVYDHADEIVARFPLANYLIIDSVPLPARS